MPDGMEESVKGVLDLKCCIDIPNSRNVALRLLGLADAEAVGDKPESLAIVFLSLVCEAEECEEDERAEDGHPSRERHPKNKVAAHAPVEAGDLFNAGVVEVGVLPAAPWV